MPELKTWQLTAGAAVLGLALSAGASTAAGPWDSGQRKAERVRAAAWEDRGGVHHERSGTKRGPEPAPSAPGVLTGVGGSVPRPTPQALADVLDPLLASPALGPRRAAAVVDAATGELLYGSGEKQQLTPASVTKIATAVAALSSLGPDHRITTEVVRDGGADGGGDEGGKTAGEGQGGGDAEVDRLVLAGAGDPSLDSARLKELAADTARALDGRTTVELAYDASLYSGPELHPIGPNTNIAPVSALMVDEARLDASTHGPAPRGADPAGAAAQRFAQYLGDQDVRVTAVTEDEAPEKAETVASTVSPTLATLVERMLTHSDNDIAEALARQTALAAGEPVSFEGAARAVADRLSRLDLPSTGDAHFADGSGLDRADHLSAGFLAALLARASDPAHPGLRPAVTGLPVAGFTGTLQQRYDGESAGTGLIRAKTGTLTGVNTLAGTVVDAGGRLLTFAFLTTGTTDPTAAQAALDRMASALVGCGCR